MCIKIIPLGLRFCRLFFSLQVLFSKKKKWGKLWFGVHNTKVKDAKILFLNRTVVLLCFCFYITEKDKIYRLARGDRYMN